MGLYFEGFSYDKMKKVKNVLNRSCSWHCWDIAMDGENMIAVPTQTWLAFWGKRRVSKRKEKTLSSTNWVLHVTRHQPCSWHPSRKLTRQADPISRSHDHTLNWNTLTSIYSPIQFLPLIRKNSNVLRHVTDINVFFSLSLFIRSKMFTVRHWPCRQVRNFGKTAHK